MLIMKKYYVGFNFNQKAGIYTFFSCDPLQTGHYMSKRLPMPRASDAPILTFQ